MKYCKKCGLPLIESEPYHVKRQYDRDTGKLILIGNVLFKCLKYRWYNLHDYYEASVELEEVKE
jgi:hypothetical protein